MNYTDMENENLNLPTDAVEDSVFSEEALQSEPVEVTEAAEATGTVNEAEPVEEAKGEIGEKKENAPKKERKLPFDLKLSKKTVVIGSAVIAAILIAVILTVTLVLTVGKKPSVSPKYAVTFETEGGSDVAPYALHEGDTIARPLDPTKEMFRFVNWYKEQERTTVFDFGSKMPARDITIYAGWASEESVLITFDANGGSFSEGATVKGKVIDYGAAATAIDVAPTYTGYLFGGWSLTKGGDAYAFGQNLGENLTLYAIWNKNPAYAYVSYYENGELVLKSAVQKGATLTKAEYGTEGLISDGWYVGAEKATKYDFGAAINEDLDLYATCYTEGLTMENGVVTNYQGTSKNIVIPDEYNGKKITEIGAYAFGTSSEFFKVKNVKLPYSVTKIGEGAFYNCTTLENINLSSSVTVIGASAFSGCTRMQTFGDISSVTEIGERAFLGCESVFAVVLSENLVRVGRMAFADCKNLTEMVIPESLLNISDMLFAGCTKLKKVDFKADGMAQMTFGKEIFTDSGVETVIIRSKSRANFAAVTNGYLLSPFIGCENLTIFVDSATINAYRNYYGNLDNDSFGTRLAEIA